MMFHGKYDRARALQKEQMKGRPLAADQDDLEGMLEQHDTLALILSALLTFLPVALIAIGLVGLIGWLFIFR